MKDVLALDFDGTLVETFTARPLPGARDAVARIDSDLRVIVCTNQGGPAYRVVGSIKHPSASEVAGNLDAGLRALGLTPARLDAVYICTFPPAGFPGGGPAAASAAGVAAQQLNESLERLGWGGVAYATSSPGWRKPAPGMLQKAAVELITSRSRILYVGDQESDREFAAAAGCRFQWVSAWWAGEVG